MRIGHLTVPEETEEWWHDNASVTGDGQRPDGSDGDHSGEQSPDTEVGWTTMPDHDRYIGPSTGDPRNGQCSSTGRTIAGSL